MWMEIRTPEDHILYMLTEKGEKKLRRKAESLALDRKRLVDMDNLSVNKDEVFSRCISEYGVQHQADVMIEEMSELTKALLKYRRAAEEPEAWDYKKTKDEIVDELADVRIMARQMEIAFQVGEEVEKRIDFKVRRQLDRLRRKESERREHELAEDF